MIKKIALFLNAFLVILSMTGMSTGQEASGTSAALSPDITRRIESEVRSRYSVPFQIDISISPPEHSAVAGFDKITLTFTGGGHTTSHEFLVSTDRKTLARLERFDISQDMMSKIDVKGRPVRGNAQAKVTIINFDDFQCPYCSRMHATLFPGVVEKYGNLIKIIYKDYPLTEIHPWAMRAAVTANCLGQQSSEAYWDFADQVHAKQHEVSGQNPTEAFANLARIAGELGEKRHLDGQKLTACIAANDETSIRASMAEGTKLGVDSTPTMFINGEKVSGALPESLMRSIIDRALVAAGEKPPENKKETPAAPQGAKR